MNWQHLAAFLYQDRASLEIFGGLLLTALVKTMPSPGSSVSLLTMYTWLYDAAHQFLNTTPRPINSNPKGNL